ncbi:hypothetical protein QBC45DRAFT_397955 [Copromyces sp. CBS 386.78]|nr:hypothetical protein QBC45DRAFT_397955 [Copromyces sp. CBS 386.78]
MNGHRRPPDKPHTHHRSKESNQKRKSRKNWTWSIVPTGQSQPQRVPAPSNNEKKLSSAASSAINSLLGSRQPDTLSALYDADLRSVKPSGKQQPQMHLGKDDAAPTSASAKQGEMVQSPACGKKVSPMPSMTVQGSSASKINLLSPAINTSTLRKPVPASHQEGNTPSQLPSLPNNPMLESTNVNRSIASSASIPSVSAIVAIQPPSFTAYAPQAPATRNFLQKQISKASPDINPKPEKSLSSPFCRLLKNNNLSPTIGNQEGSLLVHHPEPTPTSEGHPSSLRPGGGRNRVQCGSSLGGHVHPCGQTRRNVLLVAQSKIPDLPEHKRIWVQHLPLHKLKGKPKEPRPAASPSPAIPEDKAVQPNKSVNTKLTASASLAPKTNLQAVYTQAERYQLAPNVQLQAQGKFQPQFSFSYNRGDSTKSKITQGQPVGRLGEGEEDDDKDDGAADDYDDDENQENSEGEAHLDDGAEW